MIVILLYKTNVNLNLIFIGNNMEGDYDEGTYLD